MKALLAAVCAFGFAFPLNAASLQFSAGDKDCFGLGASCAPGDRFSSDLGGEFFKDYSNHGDPVGTDFWDIGPREFLFPVKVGSDTVVRAILNVFVAGADLAQGLTVRFGDTVVGQIRNTGAGNDEAVGLFSFVLNPARISSIARVRFSPTDIDDGYSIDYVELDLDTVPVAAVPLPATLPLLAGTLALAGLGLRRRRSA